MHCRNKESTWTFTGRKGSSIPWMMIVFQRHLMLFSLPSLCSCSVLWILLHKARRVIELSGVNTAFVSREMCYWSASRHMFAPRGVGINPRRPSLDIQHPPPSSTSPLCYIAHRVYDSLSKSLLEELRFAEIGFKLSHSVCVEYNNCHETSKLMIWNTTECFKNRKRFY